MFEKSFGEMVEESMKKKRMHYGELAEKADISKTSITDIIRKNHVPKREIIEKICKALNIELFEVKEYRVKTLVENILKSYSLLENINLQTLELAIDPLYQQVESGIEQRPFDYKNWEEDLSFINLNIFPKEKRKYIINIVREFRNSFEDFKKK